MKRYDAWNEADPQCGFGGGRCELYERTMGQYVTFDDHERAVATLTAERDELQRRLGEIAKHAAAPNWGDIVCAGGKLELATTRLDEIRAIAEGRDNG